jgi:hypothetical protein
LDGLSMAQTFGLREASIDPIAAPAIPKHVNSHHNFNRRIALGEFGQSERCNSTLLNGCG